MPCLVNDIVTAAIVELSQVPGAATQIYATPRILQYVQDTFDMCFQQTWWESYTSFWTGTLNGTTGHLLADIVPVTPTSTTAVPIIDAKNIRNCYQMNSNRVIPHLPARVNPVVINSNQSARALYRTADYTHPKRPIKFYPVTSTDTVVLEVRQEPLHPFALTDMLYLDQMMLMLGACYMYAADDGTNPGQINKFQSLFMKRMTDMIAAESEAAVLLDPRMPHDFAMQENNDNNGIGFFIIGGSPV